MSQQLMIDELIAFQGEEKTLYARDRKKSLYITLSGFFEIWNEGSMVLETVDAKKAVQKYNSI